MDRYVYQVVIPEKLAESKWVDILKKSEPVVLAAWDPMGACKSSTAAVKASQMINTRSMT